MGRSINARGGRFRSRVHDESGFTLVELLVVVVILGIVAGAIATAFLVVGRSTKESAQRFNESHDAQIASAYLANDVQSTKSITTSVCGSGGTTVVSMLYGDSPASVVTYSYDTASGESQLTRRFCPGGGGAEPTVVLVHFASGQPQVVCDGGPCTSGSTPKVVKVTIAEQNGGYQYSLSGSRRSHATGLGPNPINYPPLLTLGAAGVAIDFSGTNAPLHVGGNIIVNSTGSPAVNVLAGNVNNGFTFTGTLYINDPGSCSAQNCTYVPMANPVADPLDGLPAPPTSGPDIHIHTTEFTPSGVIPPGIHILKAGLKMNGGSATGNGVMFYVEGGTVDIGGNASLTLTPPALTPYSDIKLVIWKPDTNPDIAAISIGGTGGTASIQGLIYSPTSAVRVNGQGFVYITSVIAKSVTVLGGGNTGTVCINLPPLQPPCNA